jgi:hypothetical protein
MLSLQITEKHADPEMTLLIYLWRKCILKHLSHTATGSRGVEGSDLIP